MALRGIDTVMSRSNLSQKNPNLEISNFNTSNLNMKKSGLSNSIPVSGILKNQTKTSSLAASYGLMRKDPANLTNEGLGLNPNINVNVEDEYIENLLKQIHFLGLEIKLIKEKQEEEKGKLGVAGLLSKEGKPLMDHIIDSENKYKILKETTDQKIARAQNNLLLAQNENKKLQAQKDHLLERMEDLKKTHDDMMEYFEKTIDELKTKLHQEQVKKEEGEDKIIILRKTLEKTIDEHGKKKKEQDLRKMNKDLADLLFKEEEKMYIDDEEFKTQLIAKLEEDINLKKEEMKKNFKYQENLKKNQEMKARLSEAEKDLDDVNYKVYELEHLQTLSIKQKEADADERRKLIENIDKAKEDLEDLKKTNALKIEKKLKESESAELKKLQDFYKTQENLLNDLKMKFEKSETNMKKLKTEMYHKNSYLNELINANEELETKMNDITQDLAVPLQKYNELKEKVKEESLNVFLIFDFNSLKIDKILEQKEDREKLNIEMKDLQMEFFGLNASFKHFAENVKLDEDLHHFDLDELAKITNSNNQINEVIGDLMGRWDGIKKFSKNVHAPIGKN